MGYGIRDMELVYGIRDIWEMEWNLWRIGMEIKESTSAGDTFALLDIMRVSLTFPFEQLSPVINFPLHALNINPLLSIISGFGPMNSS